ncbi:MAG: hydroxymethylbilane synthase [Hyphomicrobiaceae bacterium]
MQAGKIRIGTRGSPLALAQAHETRDRLIAAHGLAVEAFDIVVIRTSGDRIQDRPLAEAGGKGLFTREIEEAMLAGEIDLAVHSMKDMPTQLPDGLTMAAILPRADVRDGFVALTGGTLGELGSGKRVGTSSLRRAAQVLHFRPDLVVVPFRGNVETRLRKLSEGQADATLLACCGLERLGMAERITSAIDTTEMLPAVAQGAVGIEARLSDGPMLDLLKAIDDERSAREVAAERAFLARLEGSCRTPIAGLARIDGDQIAFSGEILTPDGRQRHATSRKGAIADGVALATDAADDLRARGGPGFFNG